MESFQVQPPIDVAFSSLDPSLQQLVNNLYNLQTQNLNAQKIDSFNNLISSFLSKPSTSQNHSLHTNQDFFTPASILNLTNPNSEPFSASKNDLPSEAPPPINTFAPPDPHTPLSPLTPLKPSNSFVFSRLLSELDPNQHNISELENQTNSDFFNNLVLHSAPPGQFIHLNNPPSFTLSNPAIDLSISNIPQIPMPLMQQSLHIDNHNSNTSSLGQTVSIDQSSSLFNYSTSNISQQPNSISKPSALDNVPDPDQPSAKSTLENLQISKKHSTNTSSSSTVPLPKLYPKLDKLVSSSKSISKKKNKQSFSVGFASEKLLPTKFSDLVASPTLDSSLSSSNKKKNISKLSIGPAAVSRTQDLQNTQKPQSTMPSTLSKKPSTKKTITFSPEFTKPRKSGCSSDNDTSGSESDDGRDLFSSLLAEREEEKDDDIKTRILHDLTTKSNYQNIMEGNFMKIGLEYPKEIYSQIINKKTSHKITEQKRRDILKLGFSRLKSCIPLPKSSTSKAQSKISILNSAATYITQLEQLLAEKNRRIEQLESQLGKKE
ncbi:hypothetical protein BB560_006332 [Smittium megazygosporum]|uniref:BHLH domain-containing protein n=1 Tax=Smittium megazygosporum TaxID=133381 RepID=A0A2T9Y949_9FUNG|nr:hypothetical protein BB560_006332 [Smittium megazygosporum]